MDMGVETGTGVGIRTYTSWTTRSNANRATAGCQRWESTAAMVGSGARLASPPLPSQAEGWVDRHKLHTDMHQGAQVQPWMHRTFDTDVDIQRPQYTDTDPDGQRPSSALRI